MTPAEMEALLDVHDALVRGSIDGTLTLTDLKAAYGEFPAPYPWPATGAILTHRLAFHRQVSGVLAGVSGVGDWLEAAATLRLTLLVRRYPRFMTFDFSAPG